MSKEPEPCKIKKLFSNDRYVIPIYQRDYAWGVDEIILLIQDIADYCKEGNQQKYYIGTLVVCEKKDSDGNCFETIDGQQRLTTLSILLSMIKNDQKEFSNIDLGWYEKLNVEFYCREKSTKSLDALFYGQPINNNNEYNAAIRAAYDIIKEKLPNILNDEKLTPEKFCNYLFNDVIILRVTVPENTGSNRYFEIMNSRGEQLKKHEILKSWFLKALEDSEPDAKYAFNLIWEACANIEKYIQYGFDDTKQRGDIFGDTWNEIKISRENIYKLKPKPASDSEATATSIAELLKPEARQYEKENTVTRDDDPYRFSTIIDFPNFLLHVLRIQIGRKIPLDDKKLLGSFKEHLLNGEGKKERVKEFGYNLLKCKFLFDKYIIKRDRLTDHWSLMSLTRKVNEQGKSDSGYVKTFVENNGDSRILMLLSMFHVSTPTFIYKYWLNGALKYVFETKNVDAVKYQDHLEDLAYSFLHKLHLSSKSDKDYSNIIYGGEMVIRTGRVEHTYEEKSWLDRGTHVEHFIFNYLDYLLWKDYQGAKEYFEIETGKKARDDKKINMFEFTSRGSVEHYYPRTPWSIPTLTDDTDDEVDNFGNLCLISSSENSRLNNNSPDEKKRHYQNKNSRSIDSIKQWLMMEYASWGPKEIEDHGAKMKKLLLDPQKTTPPEP